jgi:rhodanese-related sulfurtransferase
VAVYCHSGRRSKAAAAFLVKQGYNVIELEGGIMARQKVGKPVEK